MCRSAVDGVLRTSVSSAAARGTNPWRAYDELNGARARCTGC
jgi:hypothetical protein